MYFGWEGRTMTSASTMTTDYVFTYYENGLRKTKTDVQGIMSYEYVYDGTTLVMETFVDLYSILYIYDDKGAPIGFKYRGVNYASDVWDVYWYEKNLQGDVVAVYSATGTKLISYEYDAWGNFTTTYHNNGSSSVAKYNKYTYRGYYYDPDLKMYYLQSRYYDPAICRFISPDDTSYLGANGDLVSFNLYAYCSNDPVNFTDPTGHSILTVLIIGVIVGGVIGGSVGGVIAYNAAKESGAEGRELFSETIEGTLKGAVTGGIFGGLVSASLGTGLIYGWNSIIATATITGTITISARAVEVGILQNNKNLAEGYSGWQIANNVVTSLYNNTGRILSPSKIKIATTANSFISSYMADQLYKSTPKGMVISYALALYACFKTVESAFASDPVRRANQRGYYLI